MDWMVSITGRLAEVVGFFNQQIGWVIAEFCGVAALVKLDQTALGIKCSITGEVMRKRRLMNWLGSLGKKNESCK
jgi:hypothetical protein